MPPRRGIVKSGNAGNSKSAVQPEPVPDTKKALFPPGSKYPLSLLNERCQKAGWERPVVDTRRIGTDQFTFTVTLNHLNKKTSEMESVRFETYPPYTRPTAIEARHWGATYALYRFCNSIQLNLVLPPGPREYWNELLAEHRTIPEHQKWMYDQDPFAAARMVKDRQQKAVQRQEVPKKSGAGKPSVSKPGSKEFESAPEVKMATSLRELVEDTIKKTFSPTSENSEDSTVVLQDKDIKVFLKQLGTLGFKVEHARKATDFLSKASPLTSSLLETLTPLEACMQYLILHIPECDLPARFMPTINSSISFITSAHSGTDDLKLRWLEEKMVKEAGWPSHAVKEVLASNQSFKTNEPALVGELCRRLMGQVADTEPPDIGESEELDWDEVEGLGGSLAEDGSVVAPLPIAPFKLHIFVSPGNMVSKSGPPMYISSQSVPAYIRLHLLSTVLQAATDGTLSDPYETFFGSCLRVIEEGWVDVEDNGPPDVSQVLRHLMPRREVEVEEVDTTNLSGPIKGSQRKHTAKARDKRTDAQVKEDFEASCREDKYKTMLALRQKLPAFTAKDQFLTTLAKSRVVVVVGETGSGKTTQLPQFILDSLILSNSGSAASILITQPRRLSAISVAARVSDERLGDGSVGYAIRGESKQTPKTKLLFCTTGVVLRRLSSGDQLKGVTHVIVDEVHERSVDGDFLLLELKDLLAKNSEIKVVLMSATINQETFVKYYNGAPLISIPGLTYPVEDIYLEDVISSIDYRPVGVRPTKKVSEEDRKAFQNELEVKGLEESHINVLQTLNRSDHIDYQLISSVANYIVKSKPRGGILIFLTGVQEIRQCINALGTILGKQAEIFPLHANLTNDEQRLVFRPTQKWKIVVSTNVAETSITIEDIIYVIDAGKVKETRFDAESGITRLLETWTSKAAGRQRRGRAGRTQPGVCYKLYTRKQERSMADFSIPEILRVPLDSISLNVKATRENEDVKAFLRKAIDPPQTSALDNAWNTLKELGAIDESNNITALGRHIAMLPVDLRLAKMMLLGTIFQCLAPVLTVAACLSSKPLFLNPQDHRDEAMVARRRFVVSGSDLLTDARAYHECARLRSEGKNQNFIKTFCEESFISASTVRDIGSLRQDLFSNLAETGFIPHSAKPEDEILNANASNENLVKSIILGGLWPRVARVHLPNSAIKFDKVQAGTVQRENVAKDFRLYDFKEGRVFLHPSSVLFGEVAWKSHFVAYFNKQETTKTFLRDATQVPTYALLLFGGSINVNHVANGLTVGGNLRLKAWPRIGVLCQQLRKLLDAELSNSVEQGTIVAQNSLVVRTMMELITGDGLTVR